MRHWTLKILLLTALVVGSARISSSQVSWKFRRTKQRVFIAQICPQDCTDVARDGEPLLVLSTLGGGLTALDMATNEIKWSIDDGQ